MSERPDRAGRGMNADGNGQGMAQGRCIGVGDLAAKGTLTAEQHSTLAAMAQEEKLAHDLYVAFGDRYDAAIFDRIAGSETQHLTIVRALLDRYGLADPTAGAAEAGSAIRRSRRSMTACWPRARPTWPRPCGWARRSSRPTSTTCAPRRTG